MSVALSTGFVSPHSQLGAPYIELVSGYQDQTEETDHTEETEEIGQTRSVTNSSLDSDLDSLSEPMRKAIKQDTTWCLFDRLVRVTARLK